MPDVNDTLTWKGAWATAQSYEEDDQVSSGGAVFVCVADHTSSTANQPPNSDFWDRVLAEDPTSIVSVTQYRSDVKDSDPGNDADIAESIKAVTDWINASLGFKFIGTGAAVERFFQLELDANGCWPLTLTVPPIASSVGLIIKTDDNGDGTPETTWGADDVRLLPLNAVADGLPFTEIGITPWGTKGRWPVRTLISVTAVWGWANGAPAGVKRECIRLVSMARKESGWATLRIDDLGVSQGVSREARQVAADLLRIYHPTGGIGVA